MLGPWGPGTEKWPSVLATDLGDAEPTIKRRPVWDLVPRTNVLGTEPGGRHMVMARLGPDLSDPTFAAVRVHPPAADRLRWKAEQETEPAGPLRAVLTQGHSRSGPDGTAGQGDNIVPNSHQDPPT